jgi:hypothetical protein
MLYMLLTVPQARKVLLVLPARREIRVQQALLVHKVTPVL